MTTSWKPLTIGGGAAQTPAPPAAVQRPPDRQRPRLEPICVTKAEAAEMLGISESVIGKLIARGELPVVRAETRLVRLRVVDLHKWAAERLCRGSDEQNAEEPSIKVLQ